VKYIDLFAGIGGFRYGLEKTNITTKSRQSKQSTPFDCVFSNEWDKYAAQIYKKHYEEIDTNDIRKIDPKYLPDFNLLCAGFPCQAFSVAGKRQGFEDTRGTLFFEIARIAKYKRPRYLLLENVKGLLSHDKGKTFQTIIGVLSDLGYRVEWQILNSKHFGVPQNRERVFIVGHLGGGSGRKVFPIAQGSKGDLRYSGGVISAREKWLKDGKNNSRNFSQGQRIYDSKGISQTLAGNAGGQGGKTGLYTVKQLNQSKESGGKQPYQQNRVYDKDGLSVALGGKAGVWSINTSKIRRLTPTECSRLQSFPDNWTKHGVVEATPVMYNKGYVDAKKENATKILRVLRKAVGEDKGERRRFAESITLFEKEILQPQLYAKRLQGNLERGGSATAGELQSKTVDSCDRMFEVWEKEKLRHTPQRQKQIEQQLGELRSIVSGLPHKITQEGRRVECTQEEQEQERQVCFNWLSDTQRYKCLGNAVTTSVVTAIGERLLTTHI